MRRIFDQPMTGAQRQARYHAKKMAARKALVTRTQIDPVAVDPALARFAMTGEEMSKVLGGLPVMSDAELLRLQALPGGSDPADFDPDAEDEDE